MSGCRASTSSISSIEASEPTGTAEGFRCRLIDLIHGQISSLGARSGIGGVLHFEQLAIESHGLSPDNIGGELLHDEASCLRRVLRTQLRFTQKPVDGIGQRLRIVNRHQKTGLAGNDDLAATGNVGGDHGARACGGLQERERQAFAVGRQNGDVCARPKTGNVIDVTEPGDARFAVPRCRLLGVTEAGLAGSGVPAINNCVSTSRARNILCASTSVRIPLFSRRRPTKAAVGGPAGSGSGNSRADVDAGAGNERDAGLCNAERHQCCPVVVVLYEVDDPLAVEQEAEHRADRKLHRFRLAVVEVNE